MPDGRALLTVLLGHDSGGRGGEGATRRLDLSSVDNRFVWTRLSLVKPRFDVDDAAM